MAFSFSLADKKNTIIFLISVWLKLVECLCTISSSSLDMPHIICQSISRLVMSDLAFFVNYLRIRLSEGHFCQPAVKRSFTFAYISHTHTHTYVSCWLGTHGESTAVPHLQPCQEPLRRPWNPTLSCISLTQENVFVVYLSLTYAEPLTQCDFNFPTSERNAAHPKNWTFSAKWNSIYPLRLFF